MLLVNFTVVNFIIHRHTLVTLLYIYTQSLYHTETLVMFCYTPWKRGKRNSSPLYVSTYIGLTMIMRIDNDYCHYTSLLYDVWHVVKCILQEIL